MRKDEWRTKDGTVIRVKDMDDDHLRNTIRMLQKNALAKRELHTLSYLVGPYPQGEMAQVAFDSEFDQLLDSSWMEFVPEVYNLMLEEARVRGIEAEYDEEAMISFEVSLMNITLDGLGKKKKKVEAKSPF